MLLFIGISREIRIYRLYGLVEDHDLVFVVIVFCFLFVFLAEEEIEVFCVMIIPYLHGLFFEPLILFLKIFFILSPFCLTYKTVAAA